MKLSLTLSGIGALAFSALVAFAQDESPTQIRIVDLADDSGEETVAATPELQEKPQTISISADALVEAAEKSGQEMSANKVNMANVKSLIVEGTVIPPSSAIAKTLEEAVRNILVQAGKQVGCVSSNGIEQLTMEYHQLGDGKSYEVEWRKALRLLLGPVGYNFTEDGELVLFGLVDEVDIKHHQLAQERLSSNRTPILFTTNEQEGMELRNAIRDISVKAGVTISTDFMDPGDLYVPVQSSLGEGTISAEDIGKAKQKAQSQQTRVKVTRFDTNGQQIEWRTVLREVLTPHDYGFVEVDGVVRVAKFAKIAEWAKAKENAKPLVARVVRVYHANPETIVEKLLKMKVLRHPSASVQIVAKKEDKTEVFRGSQAGVTVGSGTRTGASNIGNSSAFGNLRRPRTPPAILIFDVEENLSALEEKIRMMDIRERQVLVEVIVFDVEDGNGENGERHGIDWGETFQNMQLTQGGWNWGYQYAKSNVKTWTHDAVNSYDFNRALGAKSTSSLSSSSGSPSSSVNTSTSSAQSELTSSSDNNRTWNRKGSKNMNWTRDTGRNNQFNVTFGPINFEAVIDLINTRTDSRLLSSPMVVIGDHCETVIQVGDAIPIPLTRTSYVGSESASGIQDTEWQVLMTGTTLWISPEVTADGKGVRLSVHPQITKPGEMVYDRQGGGYPKVSSQELDTRVTIPSGCTLLLGGLITNNDIDEEHKVWLLGDIPWIGQLFCWRTKTLARRNLMILLRPTILDDDLPVSGFEKPTLKYTEHYTKGLGRTLDLKKSEMDDMLLINDGKALKKLIKGEPGEIEPVANESEIEPVLPKMSPPNSLTGESLTGSYKSQVEPVKESSVSFRAETLVDTTETPSPKTPSPAMQESPKVVPVSAVESKE